MYLYIKPFYNVEAPYVKFRRMPCSFLPLFIYIHRYAGLEFHGIFVRGNLGCRIDGDLFNQPPDKRLVVFGQDCGLLPKEGAHVGDAVN